jgi:hypothetical protein
MFIVHSRSLVAVAERLLDAPQPRRDIVRGAAGSDCTRRSMSDSLGPRSRSDPLSDTKH